MAMIITILFNSSWESIVRVFFFNFEVEILKNLEIFV